MFTSLRELNCIRLPTGSKYYGKSDRFGMQGYGVLISPDGTKYAGHFQNNQYHGEGTISMPKPHEICFSVLHQEGKLKQITRISFDDNLNVDFELEGDTISFDNWKYCTAQDRRFNGEVLKGLQAVGPQSYKTADGPRPKTLRSNHFDLGFCEVNRLGCVINMPTHMSRSTNFYVSPRAVRRWIHENCRHGKLLGRQLKKKVLAKFARQIIRNNVEAEEALGGKQVLSSWQVCRRSSSVESLYSSGRELTSDSSDTKISHNSLMDHRPRIVSNWDSPNSTSQSLFTV